MTDITGCTNIPHGDYMEQGAAELCWRTGILALETLDTVLAVIQSLLLCLFLCEY